MKKKPAIQIIGRESELARLTQINESSRAQFIAVYGRRRVGKTFLVREFFQKKVDIFFSATGMKGGDKSHQLEIFQEALSKTFAGGNKLPTPKTWKEAFSSLESFVRSAIKKEAKSVLIFLDELPWLATPRSMLLESLDHWWNTTLSLIPEVRLVVCGSSASWMLKNIVYAKGGLHNRLTGTIRLAPFHLNEIRLFLQSRGFRYSDQALIDLYMVTGGVPYYLELLNPRISVAQNIGTLCFGGGELHNELENLFAALFDDKQEYLKIIRKIALSREGISRTELSTKLKVSNGGRFSDRIDQLIESGFIDEIPLLYREKRGSLLRLMDEFILFSLSWIKKAAGKTVKEPGIEKWLSFQRSQAYKTWAGYAFENLCIKHHLQIKKLLGFGAVHAKVAPWRYHPSPNSAIPGAQIDLVFEREDQVITICEIKYSDTPLQIDKKMQGELSNKLNVFRSVTGTKKQLQLVLITKVPAIENEYFKEHIHAQIVAEQLLT